MTTFTTKTKIKGKDGDHTLQATVDMGGATLLMTLAPDAELNYVHKTYENIPLLLANIIGNFTGLPVHDSFLQAYTRYFQGLNVLVADFTKRLVPDTSPAVCVAQLNHQLSSFHQLHMTAWREGDPMFSTEVANPRLNYEAFAKGFIAIQADTKLGHIFNIITAYNQTIEFNRSSGNIDANHDKLVAVEVTLLQAKTPD